MKFTPEVIAALQTLRDNADNDFERHRLDVLERDLTAPPQVEVIDDTHQKFNGVIYTSKNNGHYEKYISIHRVVWFYYHGEIPEGNYHIHHIDHNKSNNDIFNLQLLTRKEHRRTHYYDGFPETYTCKNCGKKFVSTIRLGTIAFCSDDCKCFWRNNKQYRRICPVCGKEFRTGHSKQKCCSYICAVKARPPKEKICPTCGKKFSTQNRRQLYCSASCRSTMWQQKHPEKSCSAKMQCQNKS